MFRCILTVLCISYLSYLLKVLHIFPPYNIIYKYVHTYIYIQYIHSKFLINKTGNIEHNISKSIKIKAHIVLYVKKTIHIFYKRQLRYIIF